MTEPEKMEGAMSAYAQVILNTAKEAAARVLAAELRTRRLVEDLNSTKEESSQMLMRLKQMIDALSKEAEITSLNQQSKIDELECQLNEAEGVIIDLRGELNHVQEQLEKEKQKSVHLLGQNKNAERCYMTQNGECGGSLQSGPGLMIVDDKLSCLDRNTLSYTYSSPLEQRFKENSEWGIYYSDDHPASALTKKSELVTNGCDQSFCLTETHSTNEPPHLGEKSNPLNNSTYIVNVNDDIPKMGEDEKHHAVSVVRRSNRKRKLKFWGDVMVACGLRRPSHQLKKPRESFLRRSPCRFSDTKKSTKSCEDRFKREYESQVEERDDLIEEFPNEKPWNAELLQEKDMQLIDVPVQQDELATIFGLNSSSRIDCDVEGITATKASNIGHSNRKRFFKYTFSRKHKKASIYPGKVSSEQNLKQSDNSDIAKPSMTAECSRESKQLVQVAHQLISFSGRGGSLVADQI